MSGDPSAPLRMERITLDAGLEVVRQEAPAGAATFAATYFAPAGWAFDTPATGGRAVLVAELLACGAGRRNRAELARLLDRFGATLTSHCHPESTEVTLWGPELHLDPLLPLLADAVLRPRFDPDEIERVRRQLRERQMRERTQPDRTAEKRLFGRIFPRGHPYRETGLGTPSSLARLGRSELEQFHADRFRDRGSGLAISCRRRSRPIAHQLNGLFGSAERRPAPAPPNLPAPNPAVAEPLRLVVPGGSQVEIRIGGASLPRADPTYPAAFLANEILGGRSLLSRLFQDLREKRGLVYHAASELEAMRWGGYWTAEAATEPRRVPRVLDLLAREIRGVGATDPKPAELERVRESVIGSVWIELENTATAHELAVDVAYHGLPTDFYADWPDRLRSIPPRAIRDAAAVALDPAHASTVVAGPVPTDPDTAP